MALNLILESIDNLDDTLKQYYTQGDDGKFKLDVSGLPDVDKITQERDAALTTRNEYKTKLSQAEQDLQAKTTALSELEKAVNNDEKLDAKWRAKTEELKNEFEQKENKYRSEIDRITVDAVATSISERISTAPTVIRPHIRSKLKSVFEDGKSSVKVIDSDGELSTMTVEELEKSFVSNDDFSSIIKGSLGSGSNASNKGSHSGQPSKPKDLSRASVKDMVAHVSGVLNK